MDVDHARVTGIGDDHEAIAFMGLQPGRDLRQRSEEHRRLILETDEIRLLALGIALILDPFIPTVGRHQRPATGPKLFEKLAGGHRLDPRVDRVRPLALRPEWRPAPFHSVDMQAILGPAQDMHLGGRRNIEARDGLAVVVADHVTQELQLQEELVHSGYLRNASAHGGSPDMAVWVYSSRLRGYSQQAVDGRCAILNCHYR